jgi:hypothetical protein
MLRGVGMASNRAEGDRYLLGPCGVNAACLLQSEQARLVGLDLSPFPVGVKMTRGHELLRGVQLRQRKGIVADPDLSIWPGPHNLAGPQSFGLAQASILRATRAAN